jgi:RNase P subunit RPR2
MIPSIKGGWLPESWEDFEQLQIARKARWTHCRDCKALFGPENTQTEEGWRETQISQFCENCFNARFAESKDSGVDKL